MSMVGDLLPYSLGSTTNPLASVMPPREVFMRRRRPETPVRPSADGIVERPAVGRELASTPKAMNRAVRAPTNLHDAIQSVPQSSAGTGTYSPQSVQPVRGLTHRLVRTTPSPQGLNPTAADFVLPGTAPSSVSSSGYYHNNSYTHEAPGYGTITGARQDGNTKPRSSQIGDGSTLHKTQLLDRVQYPRSVALPTMQQAGPYQAGPNQASNFVQRHPVPAAPIPQQMTFPTLSSAVAPIPQSAFKPGFAKSYKIQHTEQMAYRRQILGPNCSREVGYKGNKNGKSFLRQDANLPNEKNCALWIMRIPEPVNIPAFVAAMSFGKIHAISFHEPDEQHPTFGAKVVLFEPASAANALAVAHGSGIYVDGRRLSIHYNRQRCPRNTGPQSRVLCVSGPRDLMHVNSWLYFFSSFCIFQTSATCTWPEDRVTGRVTCEFHFLRVDGQSQMCYKGIMENKFLGKLVNDKHMFVWYGRDPCEMGMGRTY
jgi:hypothetical protein